MAHFYYHHQHQQQHQMPPAPSAVASSSYHRHPPHPHSHVASSSHTFAPPAPRHHRDRAPPAPAPSKAHSKAHHSPALDPILAFHKRPALEFDVSLSPQHIKLLHSEDASSSSYTRPTQRVLALPAVTPPQPFLHITCPLLRWPIDVYPAAHHGAVTVGDVLTAIYRQLRTQVSAADWHAAPPHMQELVRVAYDRRCRRHPHAERVHEESRGLRRVDWLMKNTMFQGLRPGTSPDHWEMHIRPGEKSVKFIM